MPTLQFMLRKGVDEHDTQLNAHISEMKESLVRICMAKTYVETREQEMLEKSVEAIALLLSTLMDIEDELIKLF